ncbi:MAG: helix-turn-helix domain-containing protein [Defluviitaleaceae bacterium]|nr:helix-turn-helix domain-containing protein [Defluviitaleaceae bacterium]
MNGINLAPTITSKRKEKNLTQEELAAFMGVTKASVSKWETGQSYPDITFLPQLAAFFNISIDELIGYQPQMTEDDIRKLYKEISIEFTTKPYEDVLSRCREITKKYFSCFPLLLQIGLLYINYGYYTVPNLSEDEKAAITVEAKELFVRVKTHSDNIELRHFAHHMVAACELILGNPEEVVNLFHHKRDYLNLPIANEIMLSQAYQMLGKEKEAKTTVQTCLFDGIAEFIGTIPYYLQMCIDDINHFDEICKRTLETIRIWNAGELFPTSIMSFYVIAAIGYVTNSETNKALEMLETYTQLATSEIFPIRLKNDSFFSLVDTSTDDLPFGIAEVPRDEESIKQSMVSAITENPALAALQEDPKYVSIVNKLKFHLLKGGK